MKVVFTRGALPESEHAVAWCATGPDGAMVGESEAGAAALGVFARSAVKPLQALPAVRAGVLERLGLGDSHLALACASHGGSEEHLAVVREVLDACGLSEDDLGCGPLEPRDPAVEAALRSRGERATPLMHNCSGKHALALALCHVQGWPHDGYLEDGHPLQVAMRAAVGEAVGRTHDEVPFGHDGCGMLAFNVELGGLAAAFGRLAAGGLGDGGDRVAVAMRVHPELVAYPDALDTELMRGCDGLVAKIGAEGVLAVGLTDGRGLALKVRDGALRAIDPAGVALVRERLGVAADTPALRALAHPVLRNSRGETIGEARVVAS